MNGNRLFLDTNIILYFLSGDETLAELLDGKQFYLSFITQLELLAYSGISGKEQKIIEELLNQCIIIDINTEIKIKVIEIRKKYKLKLPDSIISATSLYLDLPLITADSEFKLVKELNLIYYER
ncbi:MAG: type II toxin-antitoxin system VapC family toxin [Bacteroidales bacterium]|nr:type II toxin-antitoxin system VapC family toxin [Bacteroidales bacterium]